MLIYFAGFKLKTHIALAHFFKAPTHPQPTHTGVYHLFLPDETSSQACVGVYELCWKDRTTYSLIVLIIT